MFSFKNFKNDLLTRASNSLFSLTSLILIREFINSHIYHTTFQNKKIDEKPKIHYNISTKATGEGEDG